MSILCFNSFNFNVLPYLAYYYPYIFYDIIYLVDCCVGKPIVHKAQGVAGVGDDDTFNNIIVPFADDIHSKYFLFLEIYKTPERIY